MFGRYVLILVCFLVFIPAILEIRKEKLSNISLNIAFLEWKRKNMFFDLGEKNLIGKSSNCDIVIKSHFVKRQHLKLYLDCEEWLVSPLKNSKVYINNYPIEQTMQIQDGDTLSFGHEKMIFHIAVPEEEINDD